MIRALGVAILIMCVGHAKAGNDASLYGEDYDACIDASGGVTLEIMTCNGEEHARQDKRLNAAYKTAMSELSEQRKNELRAVQRLWLQFRDANCQFFADPDGGTAAAMSASSCHLEMTALRARELESLSP